MYVHIWWSNIWISNLQSAYTVGNTAKTEVHIFRIGEILSFNKFEKVVHKFTYVKYVFAAKSKKATEWELAPAALLYTNLKGRRISKGWCFVGLVEKIRELVGKDVFKRDVFILVVQQFYLIWK